MLSIIVYYRVCDVHVSFTGKRNHFVSRFLKPNVNYFIQISFMMYIHYY